jgi:putative SOS response-associated peptidase YedK
MCGRFTVTVSGEDLFDEFGFVESYFDIRPRYNVAPMQLAPVLLRGDDGALGIAGFRWGLVPVWAKDAAIGNRMINARAETVAEKPTFRAAFRQRRCLVPADGWYEWRREGTRKVPMWIHLRSRRPFAFAGLWERWRAGEDTDWLNTFTIVTSDAAPGIRHIHDRMPVVLPRGERDRWLDPATDPGALRALLRPYAGDDLEAWPVSTLVNSPRNDLPECVRPTEPPEATSSPGSDPAPSEPGGAQGTLW